METNNKTRGQSNELIIFFLLAYALSWSIAIPLALAHLGLIDPILPPWTHYLVAYGPFLSALIVTVVFKGGAGLKEIGKGLIRVACPKWILTAFSPFLIGWLVMAILNRVTGSSLRLSLLGQVNFLPLMPAGVALLLWFFTFGLGEETGWRGFALPRLQRGRGALQATIILTVFWALWHLPQFFYLFDPAIVPGWLIGLFAGAIIFTWFYNTTDGSILMVAVWHACFNWMTASSADTGALPAVLSVVVMLWAALVVWRTKPKYLTSL